ncbi:MAG: hypothetical protein MZW92_27565 [Comamonadaceae bacterium]|nr:hypothetical protein [Comamonadaceae bacterium]
MNTESTYDWENSQWTVPINVTLTQMLKIGGQPLSFQLGYRYYAEAPDGGPDWGLRVTLTFLFPNNFKGGWTPVKAHWSYHIERNVGGMTRTKYLHMRKRNELLHQQSDKGGRNNEYWNRTKGQSL